MDRCREPEGLAAASGRLRIARLLETSESRKRLGQVRIRREGRTRGRLGRIQHRRYAPDPLRLSLASGNGWWLPLHIAVNRAQGRKDMSLIIRIV